jgi:uncharacterized membrane protein SpoIIM required for sporulation
MRRQEPFIALYRPEWERFAAWLDWAESDLPPARRPPPPEGLGAETFPARYRRLCQQLALARQRGYSPAVVEPLQALVERGHRQLYRPAPPRWAAALRFLLAGFPRLVRRHRGAMLSSAALFLLPLVGTFLLLQQRPDFAYVLFDPGMLAEAEAMYDPAAEHWGRGRDAAGDFQMFGFYVLNNIGIGFRSFASGLPWGLGALYVLVYNGLMLGGVAGHLTVSGFGETFWRFVVTHGAPELIALVIAGGAGLQIGFALISPGRRRRRDALVAAGRDGAKLCIGVFLLLLVAAFIEAFWSARVSLPDLLRFPLAALLWGGLLWWLLAGGRGQRDAD